MKVGTGFQTQRWKKSNSVKIAALIPARYKSSRFPGKPLAPISGVPMIERVYRQVQKSGCFSEIIVATDDTRIARTVRGFGGNARITSSDHRSGTDRIWEAIQMDSLDAVVNIQGDEPLISPDLIRTIVNSLEKESSMVVTAAFNNQSYSEFLSPHVVKVVLDSKGRALYFSRSPIPAVTQDRFTGFLQHVGIYGYRIPVLNKFVHWEPGILETQEKLEQLRFLENGVDIRVVYSPEPSFGVDVPEDIVHIEAKIERGI